ncbi:MAG: ABC transporter substrate-binding protein [Clostridiales bacterium]|nr:ABC transporter substrate-binding protein [Clostridiales bacterium]
MKKFLSLLLVCCLLLTLFAACTKKDDTPPPADDGDNETPAAETLKIGINYERSGGVATYGNSSVDGILMAFEQINAAGGVNGKLIEYEEHSMDNGSDSAEATTVATRLMTQHQVLAVLGPATSGAFKATIPVANKNKVPVISGSATADDVTGNFQYDEEGNLVLDTDGKPSGLQEYAFRICFSDSYQGTAMAMFAANDLKATKAVVITDTSSDYGKGLARNFVATFVEGGGTVVAQEGYVKDETNFNAVLTRLKGLDFDVIFIPGYYNEAGLIIKQARALGIDVPVLGADGFDSPDLLSLAGAEALNDIYFSNHYSSLSEDPVVTKFIADFKARYNREPDAFNALGYDLGMFVADALGRAAEATGEALKVALEETDGFAGVTGRFSVDAQHNPVKALVVIGLENGVQVSSVNASVS